MKKRTLLNCQNLLTVIVFFGTIATCIAQSSAGEKTANLGLSLGYGIGINGSLDLNVAPDLSIGGTATFNTGYFNASLITVGVRGAYHLGNILAEPLDLDTDKNDPYIGLGLGYRGITSGVYSGIGGFGGIYLGGVAGYRYFFKESLGIYAEGGFPLSSIGLTFKL